MQIHRSRRLCAVGGSGLGAAGSGDFAGLTRALGPPWAERSEFAAWDFGAASPLFTSAVK